MEDVLAGEIDPYLEKNWESIVADIERVVRIESTEDLPAAKPGAPFGPGPRAALTEALDIARGMGFEVHDVDGYAGYADLPGESDTQIGIIGHVDVVPAGPGWTVEPFAVTRREGYLMGRGVIDDKGPIVTTLHAVKFWLDKGEKLPYTIRVIFGANEETGMHDVPYCRRFADPAFLFTPDAEFPVSYGEEVLYDATLTSKRFEGGAIIDIEGGAAPNAVPGIAHAIVRADTSTLPQPRASSSPSTAAARIERTGKAASKLPHLGKSAIDLLVAYLLENDVCTADEKAFFELVRKLTSATDGSNLGIKTADEHFGELAVVGGTICMQDGRVRQTLDSRFPTSTTPEQPAPLPRLRARSAPISRRRARLSRFSLTLNRVTCRRFSPHITRPRASTPSPSRRAAARTRASSPAPLAPMPWIEMPEWAGGMHGPDETVPEELLKKALDLRAHYRPSDGARFAGARRAGLTLRSARWRTTITRPLSHPQPSPLCSTLF